MGVEKNEENADFQRIKKAVEDLGEYYESVHIFVTRHDSGGAGGTINLNMGCGNWFARYGQVTEWILKCDERSKCFIRREEKEDPDER